VGRKLHESADGTHPRHVAMLIDARQHLIHEHAQLAVAPLLNDTGNAGCSCGQRASSSLVTASDSTRNWF
jgi:hypothetical protein